MMTFRYINHNCFNHDRKQKLLFSILGMENDQLWIGLKQDASTGSWIWAESHQEANFTLWYGNVGAPCATIKALYNAWFGRPCAESNHRTLCELYDLFQ